MFDVLIVAVGILAGALASVTGFGIGSLLTPVFALHLETRLAVAAVSIPHLVGTALRFWLLGGRYEPRVLWTFGLTSAAGGLTGALLHTQATSASLTIVFGSLLLFVAVSELTGLSGRMRFTGALAWAAGAASGFLGGLVGNQGGIRSAALLGFDLPKHTFVATATAIGLAVDAARVPVYLRIEGEGLANHWWWILIATAGVMTGTLGGGRVLAWIPQPWFRPLVAIVLAALGAAMITQGVITGR